VNRQFFEGPGKEIHMALPESVQIKLISDEAGTISITPVVVQKLTLAELVEVVVSHSGKDAQRVSGVLRRGSLLQGASRYRWQGFEASPAELAPLLNCYPESEPDRPFDIATCRFIVLHFSHGGTVELERKPLTKRRTLRRKHFWGELERLTAGRTPQYLEYSYREQADRYRLSLLQTEGASLREAAVLLPYSNLAQRLKTTAVGAVDFYNGR
jgi:hypothetical protein